MIEEWRRNYLIVRIKENSIAREDSCIVWTGTKNRAGYGMIHFAKMLGEGWEPSTSASRAHYMAHHNVILERNQFVCHKCDNPACVNIDHLFVGTPTENIQDCIKKGRRAKEYKPHKRVRVHSDELILAIKQARGKLKEVADKYGVSESYVSKLRAGKAKPLVN